MFRGMSRVFEEDPFFRDPFAAHTEHLRQCFSEPLRSMDQRGRPDSQVALRNNHMAMSCCSLMPFGSFGGMETSFPLMPFGSFDGMGMNFPLIPFGCFGGMNIDFRSPFSAMNVMMSNMRNAMMDLQANFDKMALDPNAHTFCSSSMMTYTKKGDEPPKVFQASAQTRMAPGGIKETRKALKDSESGLEKMAIGHHIQDRAHVIQKAKNNKTGDEQLDQEFVNLDETEAHAFDEEWQKEIQKFKPSLGRNYIDAPRHRNIQHLGREDAVRREKTHPRTAIEGSRKPKSSVENLSVKGSHVPLKASKK